MSARHLDVLRELSEKNKEKEEQHRREEQRQQKRASSLRERILAKGGQDTDGKLSELPTLAPDETASAEEKRLWKIKCNLDIERRQHEAIQRLQELQRAKSLKKEREKLKCQWRAHKAKSYLLESCQNSGLKEYLESKEKPRALPKLPSNAPATSSMAKCLSSRTKQSPADCQDDAEQDAEGSPCTASTRPASPLGEVDESTTTGADDEAQEVQSVEAEPSSAQADVEPSAAEEKAAVTTVAPAKQLTSSAKEKYWYVNKMVSKLRNVCLRSARDLDEWKKRNGCPPEKQVFICTGGYPDFTQAMLNRGWFHNTDKDSRFFDLKWSPAANIDHDKLRPGQVINHFQGARDLTTKVGLTLNIRNCLPICSADPDEFYPRAFDLSDAAERADFVLDFKFSKAQAILVEFLRNVELRPEMTFSPDIVSLASKICMRTVTDVDDLIDCPDLAEALATITAEEWSVLEQVCLDDPTQRLEGALKKADLEDFIQKKSVHTAAIREREQKAAALLKEREKQQRLEQGLPLVEEKKKKKKKAKDYEGIEFCVPLASYEGAKGQHLIRQAKTILEEMGQKRQLSINGCRNAWIVKPSGKSRGRGIKVMRELDEIFRNCETDGFQWICQKYIENPQLIHGYKFDIRQWVLVTEWNPLTVYIWNQPYLRFAGQKYDETLSDRSEYIHLVNNSIIKKMDNFEQMNEDLQSHGYMWFRQQYEEWLHARFCTCEKHRTPHLRPPPYTCETFGVRWEDVAFTAKEEDEDEDGNCCPSPTAAQCCSLEKQESESTSSSLASTSATAGVSSLCAPEESGDDVKAQADNSAKRSAAAEELPGLRGENVDEDDGVEPCENLWDTCIRKQMENIITRSLMSVVEGINQRKGTVELFGYDFMIADGTDGKPEVWLIEVNSSPACDYSTPVTCPLVKKVMEDTAKVMVDLKEDPAADTGEWSLIQHEFTKPVPQRKGFSCNAQLEVHGQKVKFSKGSKKTKKKGSKTSSSSVAKAADSDAEGDAEDEEEEDDED
eukprot:TRINITY_DN1087_c0_g1_i2.p1 TRINITY_DN1087_c0_g1~~TRINITY_DN1087_c0_g1_i2.p1  ORF type:complete len:1012 (+),score=319.28 TRINITY_DN1087_c0_g1_i2:279-3314(+)